MVASAPARGNVRATIAYRAGYTPPEACTGYRSENFRLTIRVIPEVAPLKPWCALATMAPVLGETLGEARRRRGWSIEQLSKRSGVPARLIREVESQSPTYVPSETNTVLLAATLRMSAGPLLEERDRLFEHWHRRDVVR